MTRGEQLPRGSRLSHTGDYRRIFGSGRRRRLRYLDVVWVSSETGHPRLGLVVPKYQCNAVTRNRLRRRLRELWRRRIVPGLPALDVIVKARREAYHAAFEDLQTDLLEWVERWGRATE